MIVPDHDQAAAQPHSPQQAFKERRIDHRQLVDNDRVAVKWISLVAGKIGPVIF